MIKIENTEVLGWEHAIRGMRNPMNSWEKSDTWFYDYSDAEGNDICHSFNVESGIMVDSFDCDGIDVHWIEVQECPEFTRTFEHILNIEDHPHNWICSCPAFIGPNDHKLMMNLAKAGSVDAKYRRMIVVYADITAPLYWWKEFDTYKVSMVANSCSTMHKIHSKEFTLEDFSCEHLLTGKEFGDTAEELWSAGAFHVEHDYDPYALDATGIEGWYEAEYAKDILLKTIDALNYYREKFLETKDKRYWWQMIQLLPSSYNQRRTIMLNYEVLAGIYPKRKDHKLDCWHDFCDWIKSLPYSEIITLEEHN